MGVVSCKGICDSIPKPVTHVKGIVGSSKFYDGTKKWCSRCFRFFSYDSMHSRCPCCGQICRIKPVRWCRRARKEDTRRRIS